MSGTCIDLPSAVESDGRWALVLRVSTSRQLVKAPQLRDIFVYVCQRALTDPAALIKEQEIGCKVLGRKADFNPNEDNIVRVQISHLRKKLEEYFATDGKDEPIRIVIPKGSYVPRFQPKPLALALPPVKTSAPVSLLVPSLATMVAILGIFCVYLLLRPAGPPAAHGRQPDAFWSRIFGGSQPTTVVVSDTCMVMLQDILDSDVSAADYAGGRYSDKLLGKVSDTSLKSALQMVMSRQYTSLADLNLSTRMMDISRQFGVNPAAVRYARHLNIRDFKTGNFVLIGSRRGIPWVQLFESQMNFAMEKDRDRRFYFRNRKPRTGEPDRYIPLEQGGGMETYSDIALLPNLGNNGSVLILSGLSMVDTEASGEFLSRKSIFQELSLIFGSEVVRERYFEILLKTRAVAGAAESSQIVAHRAIQTAAANN